MDAMWSPPQLLGYCPGPLGQEAVLLGEGHKFWMHGLEIGGN